MTSSFRTGAKVAPSRSNTTSRSESDPRSTTAMRPGGAGRSRSGMDGYRVAAARAARFTVAQRLAAS